MSKYITKQEWDALTPEQQFDLFVRMQLDLRNYQTSVQLHMRGVDMGFGRPGENADAFAA